MPREMREVARRPAHRGSRRAAGVSKGLAASKGCRTSAPAAKHVRVMVAGRGRLGVRIESLNDDLASTLGATNGSARARSDARHPRPKRAGLPARDVITAVDGGAVMAATIS